MPPPDLAAPVTTRPVRGVRLLGWFLAANVLAVLAAVLGAAPAAAGAAERVAWWCGIG